MKRYLLIVLLLFSSSVFAETIELPDGAVYQGEIIDQDEDSIVMETEDGIVNIPRPKGLEVPEIKIPELTPAQKEEQGARMEQALEENPGLAKFIPENMKEALRNWDIGAIFNWAKEIAAKGDLRNISAAAEIYRIEANGRVPTFKELVRSGYIESRYAEGISGEYRFRIRNTGGEFLGIHADPVDKESSLDRFFLDSDGCIRYETGKSSAGPHSPMAPPGCTQMGRSMNRYEEF